LCSVRVHGEKKLGKVHITPLNFHKSLIFLPEPQNQAKHLPQLLKPTSYLPGSVINGFEGGFAFFLSFVFILDESLKSHNKSMKCHKIENLILFDST